MTRAKPKLRTQLRTRVQIALEGLRLLPRSIDLEGVRLLLRLIGLKGVRLLPRPIRLKNVRFLLCSIDLLSYSLRYVKYKTEVNRLRLWDRRSGHPMSGGREVRGKKYCKGCNIVTRGLSLYCIGSEYSFFGSPTEMWITRSIQTRGVGRAPSSIKHHNFKSRKTPVVHTGTARLRSNR